MKIRREISKSSDIQCNGCGNYIDKEELYYDIVIYSSMIILCKRCKYKLKENL